ncbi:hypothetical protein [Rossellomorea sp. NRS-1567]|uniref:hypothetical protein n=1 Tax=Rossellomorea sp. NRS-1567 TaxID=3233901 RepID=UPI003D293CB8
MKKKDIFDGLKLGYDDLSPFIIDFLKLIFNLQTVILTSPINFQTASLLNAIKKTGKHDGFPVSLIL